MTLAHCFRNGCPRRGHQYQVHIPVTIKPEVWKTPSMCVAFAGGGGGSVVQQVAICDRHVGRMKRFSRWNIRGPLP